MKTNLVLGQKYLKADIYKYKWMKASLPAGEAHGPHRLHWSVLQCRAEVVLQALLHCPQGQGLVSRTKIRRKLIIMVAVGVPILSPLSQPSDHRP